MRGKEADAVVTPAVRAGKRGHWHQLDMGDPEFEQVIQLADGCREGALRRERAGVEFVNHRRAERGRLVTGIRPLESRVVKQP